MDFQFFSGNITQVCVRTYVPARMCVCVCVCVSYCEHVPFSGSRQSKQVNSCSR